MFFLQNEGLDFAGLAVALHDEVFLAAAAHDDDVAADVAAKLVT